MTFEQYELKFRIAAQNAGYSEQNIIKCLHYAKPLIDKNLPVIYNTAHLSALVGYNKKYLKRAAQFTPYFYRSFKILKSDKRSYRSIEEPLPSLKEIQKWILNNVLYEIPISRYVKSYAPKRNIKDNIKYHRNQPKILSLDIKDFFPSIRFNKVEKIFINLGYSPLIANLLAKLCCLNGSLPQGAPTSPYLSNIYLKGFDDKLEKYCNDNSIRYTRYADDLTFSGDFNADKLIRLISNNLRLEGLVLKESKTKIMLPSQRQVVTGIVVNEKLQVPREIRKSLRQSVYYILKFGLDDHLLHTNNSKSNYIDHLLGIAKYILFINPKDAETQGLLIKLKEIKKNSC